MSLCSLGLGIQITDFAPWSNGRTAAFEAVYLGSNPNGASHCTSQLFYHKIFL